MAVSGFADGGDDDSTLFCLVDYGLGELGGGGGKNYSRESSVIKVFFGGIFLKNFCIFDVEVFKCLAGFLS